MKRKTLYLVVITRIPTKSPRNLVEEKEGPRLGG